MHGTIAPAGAGASSPQVQRVIQEPEYRVEGPLKVMGRARYTADVQLPGMLWAKFLMSPVAHARIVSMNTSAALAVPGVQAVITGRDVGNRRFGRGLFDWPVLAYDRVLFIGERVAAVAAETRQAAEEAVQKIQVEYDELPPVWGFDAALAEDAPILHPDVASYQTVFPRTTLPHPNLQGYGLVTKGEEDLEKVFAQAYRVVEDTYLSPRQHQGYIEPHACVVSVEPDGTVRVYSTNKSPFGLRSQLSLVTGVPLEKIVVDSMFIGGDFGGKGFSIDEFSCYYLSRVTGRPIKAVMTYADELVAMNPRHNTRFTLRTGVTREGAIIAHAWRALYNGGAYAAPKPMQWPGRLWTAMEVYRIPNARQEQLVVYTNTVPAGHVRAPGAVQMAFAGESHVDHIAQELGMDPLELRLLNALRPGDRGPAGESYRNPRAIEVLDALKRETAWGETPLPPNHGRGIALRRREVGQGKTSVRLRLEADGSIELLYGTPDQGSGSQTVMRRVAAAVLGVRPERIRVRYGTTADAPLDPGAGASRVTHIVGRATQAGATTLKSKLEDLAAEVMGWPAGDVRIEDDQFVASSNGTRETAAFEEVARRIVQGQPVEAEGAHDSGHPGVKPEDVEEDFSFYAYMVEVVVDPDTGAVRVVDAVQVVDVGTIINPTAHQGQLDGSFIFGLSNALLEELPTEDGKITTAHLGDYKLATQADVPPLRTVLLSTEIGPGPFGAKAAGEITNSGVAPAVANAVFDAVGARVTEMPITAERVYQALQQKP